MARRRVVWLTALTAVVALAAVVAPAAPAAPAAAQANEVTNWNRIATTTLVAFPGPAGGAPPALQINMAMTQGAVYDAVNAIEPRRQPYLLKTRFASKASKEAAAATAAYRVLSSIVSTVPASIPFPNRASLLQALDDGIRRLARGDTGHPVQDRRDRRGERRGGRDDRRTAGRRTLRAVTWVPNDDPGHWQPLLNPDGTQMLDPTPWVGGVRPFLIEELLAVPHRRSAGASQSPRGRRTSTRSKRSAR